MSVRLFVPSDLAGGVTVALSEGQSHYLSHVMRRGDGDAICLFNGRDGEWTAVIAGMARRCVSVQVQRLLRPQASLSDLTLLFAPVKKARTDFIVEKATELGVRRLWPVWTERTQSDTVRVDRLTALAIEAAEQCERMDAPEIAAPRKLSHVLADWPGDRILIFADEAGNAPATPGGASCRPPPIGAVAAGIPPGAPLAILIGPEGGFSAAERAHLGLLAFVRRASLGPRILRSDTAAAAALSVIQTVWGDCAGDRIPSQ